MKRMLMAALGVAGCAAAAPSVRGIALPEAANLSGAWGKFWQPIYRYPIIAAHVGLSLSMALWPAQKNLGTLISYSAALMLGAQFWHAHSGGLALAWYLPLAKPFVTSPEVIAEIHGRVTREARLRQPRLGDFWKFAQKELSQLGLAEEFEEQARAEEAGSCSR